MQAIDPAPYRPNTSSHSAAMPADYTQCGVRKQRYECKSETRLVKSQRSGGALTERGGFWGLDGSCFAFIAAERLLCPHGTLSRSPSKIVRLHGETHRLLFFGPELEWNRINVDRFSVHRIAHERHISHFFLPPSVSLLLTVRTRFLYE